MNLFKISNDQLYEFMFPKRTRRVTFQSFRMFFHTRNRYDPVLSFPRQIISRDFTDQFCSFCIFGVLWNTYKMIQQITWTSPFGSRHLGLNLLWVRSHEHAVVAIGPPRDCETRWNSTTYREEWMWCKHYCGKRHCRNRLFGYDMNHSKPCRMSHLCRKIKSASRNRSPSQECWEYYF